MQIKSNYFSVVVVPKHSSKRGFFEHGELICECEEACYTPRSKTFAIKHGNCRYIFRLDYFETIRVMDLKSGKLCGYWSKDTGYICWNCMEGYE